MVANCIESFYLKAPCFVSLLYSKHQLTIMIFRDLLLFLLYISLMNSLVWCISSIKGTVDHRKV